MQTRQGSSDEEWLKDSCLTFYQQFCREALVWKQLNHPNVLPFLGINMELFTPRFCLVSPWMSNGSLLDYLKKNPEHNRVKAVGLFTIIG